MIRVIKIGGRAQNDERLASAIKDAWERSNGGICLVHGGGDEVSALQKAMGRKAVFVGGRRVTSPTDIAVLRMVLSGVVNKRLVSALQTAGVPAVGLSGEDGRLIEADLIDSATLGLAGKPKTINTALLNLLLSGGYMPVISPVGCVVANSGVSGGALNVNGDDAATAIAAALGAEELLFVADVRGVLNDDGVLLQSVSAELAHDLIASGTAAGGMAAKLESAVAAVGAGVERVRITDLTGIADQNYGTCLTLSAGITS